MSAFRTLVGLGLASTMMMTAPVFAASTTTRPAAAASTTAKPATAKKVAAKPAPAMKVAAKPAPATKVAAVTPKAKITTPAKAVPARHGARLVTAKLSNGKTVTYDCSLAGTKTKQACKG